MVSSDTSVVCGDSDPQKDVPHLEFLSLSVSPDSIESLRDGLHDLGYLEGENVKINWRYTEIAADLDIIANEPGRVRIDVSDSGLSLSEDETSQLFTKFFRADNSLNREVSGTGVGLYIAKHLVNAQAGEIWAESVEGRGSKFTITVPMWDTEFDGRAPTDYDMEGET